MGLTDEEDPIFVLEDGTVLIYSLFGTFKTSFSMGQDAKDMKILAARYSVSVSLHGPGHKENEDHGCQVEICHFVLAPVSIRLFVRLKLCLSV